MKIILVLFLALAACRQNSTTANQTTPPNANVSTNTAVKNDYSANISPPVSLANASDRTRITTFDGKGVVTKINLELGSIALDHEAIEGLMPAMEGMEFYVSDKKLLVNLKIGDRVNFVLEDNAGAERIVSIKKN